MKNPKASRNFGLEAEFTGITRRQACEVATKLFHTTVKHLNGSYDTCMVMDKDKRGWKFMRDASLRCEKMLNGLQGFTV